jgi:hypothetical protein
MHLDSYGLFRDPGCVEAAPDKPYISYIRLYGALCLFARLQELWKFTDCLEEPPDGIPNDTDQAVTIVLQLRFFIARWFVLFSEIINQDY